MRNKKFSGDIEDNREQNVRNNAEIVGSSFWKITIALRVDCFPTSEDTKPYKTVKHIFESYFPNSGESPMFQGGPPT